MSMGQPLWDDIKILGHVSMSVCLYVCLCVCGTLISKIWAVPCSSYCVYSPGNSNHVTFSHCRLDTRSPTYRDEYGRVSYGAVRRQRYGSQESPHHHNHQQGVDHQHSPRAPMQEVQNRHQNHLEVRLMLMFTYQLRGFTACLRLFGSYC